jgi:lipoprotein-anchoring transpeptidase ErfK/SrfK
MSRGLIGLLIVIIALGAVVVFKNLSKSQARETAELADTPPKSEPIAAVPSAVAAVTAKQTSNPPIPTSTDDSMLIKTTSPLEVGELSQPSPTSRPSLALNTQIAAPAPSQAAPAQPAPAQPAPAPSTPTPPDANVLATAKSKFQAGELLQAREMLNAALLANSLSPADLSSAKQLMAEINQTVVFSPKRFADDPFGGTYSVQAGDLLQKIATKYDVPWEALLRVNGMSDPRRLRAGQTIKVIHGPFNAVVNKKSFTMDIYLGTPGEKGSMYVTTYPVGLGKDDSTPTGTWLVEAGRKLKNPTYYSPRGEGVIDANDPKNPLGDRWLGLTGIDGHAIGKESYGIHGTIDETSIGRQDSMGCIRLKNADVELVFDLLIDGKSHVIIRE